MKPLDLDSIDFEKAGGVVPVVAQHARTNAVLMITTANRQALEESLGTGEMHFYTQKRGLWRQGHATGYVLRVVEMILDCDHDAVLARVEPFGPTCHLGQSTCFGEPQIDAIRKLEAIVLKRATKPAKSADEVSYTRELLGDRNKRLRKLGEEASELTIALADATDKERIAVGAADVVYHVVVALQAAGVSFDDVRRELERRID